MIGRGWLLPVGWAAFILALTSIPGSAVPDVGVSSADKLVHVLLYGILGAFVARAAWDPAHPVRSVVMVAIGVSLFGAVDELHQSIIPGRSADALDWLADTIGGMTGAILIALTGRGREQAT